MSHLPIPLQALLAALAIAAAAFDLRARRVPNWLSLAGVVLGISGNLWLGRWPGLWSSLEGLGLALLIYLPLYLLRAVGAGDAKLMAAAGAIAGPANWIVIMIFTALFGGVAAIVLIAIKRRWRSTFANLRTMIASIGWGLAPYRADARLDVRNPEALRLPHAVMIACGALAYLLAARG